MDILTRLDGADPVIAQAAVEADHAGGVVFAERQPFEDPDQVTVMSSVKSGARLLWQQRRRAALWARGGDR
jgi:hypothetical protein